MSARSGAETPRRLRALLEITAKINALVPGDVLLTTIAEEAARLLDVDNAGFRLVEGDDLVVAGVAGSARESMIRPRLKIHESLSGRIVTEGRTLVLGIEEAADRLVPEHLAASRRLGYTTFLGVPLRIADRIIGVLTFRSRGPFTDEDVALAEAFAAQAAMALDHARLFAETTERLQQTTTLLSASRALSSTLDTPRLVRHLLRHVAQSLGAETVGLWMVSPDGEGLDPLAGYRVPPDVLARVRRLRLPLAPPTLYAEAARTRRPVVVADAMTDARVPAALTELAPHQTQWFVPIVVSGRMIGGFAAIWWTRTRAVGAGELALLEAVATQAGVALENARLFQENRRQVDELSALHELARAITGQLDRRAVLDAIHDWVARLLDVRTMVAVVRPDTQSPLELAFLVRDGVRDPQTPRLYEYRNAGLVRVVLETGRSIRTDDYLAECRRRGVAPVPGGVGRAWLGVPMHAGADVLGVVVVTAAGRVFTEADERLLGNIGDLAALALRSAALYEERTRAYDELQAAQEQLVRTEKLRALGEMASGVAHDFNNLLAAILGRTDLCLQRAEDPTLRQWLEVIERAALDGAQTVRRLQEFTRVRRDAPLVAVDLNGVVRDALALTQTRWRDEPRTRGVVVEVEATLGAVAPVAGDAAELREALMNMILNALDAMPGGGRLRISTVAGPDGPEVELADTGMGMPDHVRRRIFDPFFTTKGSRGTGLGLSITYGILSRHGVTISVDSAEGQGTTFRLRFPRGEALAAGARNASPPATAGGAPLGCLVVDDDDDVREAIHDMIAAAGHRVAMYGDGEAALARLDAEAFDVVFTDLAMPGLSGWDVARAVKQRALAPPVYVVTGFGVELTDAVRREHGIDGVLVKPVRRQDLLAVLAHVQQHRPHRASTEDSHGL